MSEWREIYRSVVFPWNCDHYGHMNVRWYAHHFDDAGFHMWSLVGCAQKAMRERGFHPIVAQTKIDYIHELIVGELLVIEGAFTRIGNKSVSHTLRMYNADSRVHCATQESVEVFFNPTARSSCAMPDDIRVALSTALIPSGDS